MTIYVENIGKRVLGNVFEWDSTDSIIYALGVGAGTDELSFTTENSKGVQQRALPTMAAVLGSGSSGERIAFGDFELSQILHVGQSVSLRQTLPVAGRAVVETGMSAVYDKGRNAIIETTSTLIDEATGDPIADTVMQLLIRGGGGFGGDPGASDTWSTPERPADDVVTMPTSPDQALLYRLNGDRNPLHSDPVMATQVGFSGPILHGLCTWGVTGRAVLSTVLGGDVDRFGSFSARLAAPVFPGDTLDVHLWREPGRVLFQTRVGDTVVLDRGEFTEFAASAV